jgi:rfaE bifunctional protein kinase chain/domain
MFGDQDISALFDRMSNLRVMIIGDVMIDSYMWGNVERMSPEAPVPVVEIVKKEARLGGAANVALNVMSMGATPFICSVVGNDAKGKLFTERLEERSFSSRGMVFSEDRITTDKTRIISDGQHVLRVDEEMTDDLNENDEKALLSRAFDLIDNENIDVIILEDYNKGVLTEKVISAVIERANALSIPTTVDPKKKNFFAFRNCTLFKPNLLELQIGTDTEFSGDDADALLQAVEEVEAKLGNEYSLITLSEHGIFVKHDGKYENIPAHQRNILDVSGAGDTVISVASLALAVGCTPSQIAALSNLAGGLVCEKVGVVPILKNTLLEETLSLV